MSSTYFEHHVFIIVYKWYSWRWTHDFRNMRVGTLIVATIYLQLIQN